MNSSHILLFVILLIEVVRYIPQLEQDLLNKKRPIKIKLKNIKVKATYIWIINLFIYTIFIVKLLSGMVYPILVIFGLPVYICGIVIGWFGLYYLSNQYHEEILCFNDNNRIVKDGIYSIVRHPLRVGLFLEMFGISIISSSIISFIFLTLLLFFQIYRTRQEELFLIKNYGKEYIDYVKKVPKYNIVRGIVNRIKNTQQVTTAISNAGGSDKIENNE